MSRKSDQLSIFSALFACNVEYAVVGGMAVNAHGHIRNTRDLDIFIRPTEENARAAFHALVTLGAPVEGMEPADLLVDSAHYQFHTEHDRIDILSSIGEISFDQVWQNRVDAEFEGVIIRFISRQDLIANKLQVGRLIDQDDAERLSLLPEGSDIFFNPA